MGITVSNPTNTNGDAITHNTTGRLNCVCISANTLCEAITLTTAEGNILRDTRGARRVLGSVAISLTFSSTKTRYICLGNRSISSLVEAPRVSVTTSGISGVPTIHTFLLKLRHSVTTGGGIVVSNESVTAIILPSTRIGVFLATSPRYETREECGRLLRGNRGIGCSSILTSMGTHSCRSDRHRVTPLGPTRSSIVTSASNGSLPRDVRVVVSIVGRGAGNGL